MIVKDFKLYEIVVVYGGELSWDEGEGAVGEKQRIWEEGITSVIDIYLLL